MTLTCIKNVVGEDLIGKVSTRDGFVDIEDPMMIMVVPNQQGQISIGLAPYQVYAKARKFTFHEEHIMLTYEPAAELRNEYTRLTSGIVIPTPDMMPKPDLTLVK